MNEFEDRLKEALQRREPPVGFAERVIAAVPSHRNGPLLVMHWRSAMAIAAVLLVMFSAGLFEWHRQAERARQAEAANRQLMFALKLAAEKLQRVQNRIERSSTTVKVDRDDVKGAL